MNRVAIIASYPPRIGILPRAVASIASQVDKMIVVLNQYEDVSVQFSGHFPDNVEYVLPAQNYKDVGKFIYEVADDDYVFLCDDDIAYPSDYANRLTAKWTTYQAHSPIVGVHGVTYSDFFDGDPTSRLVFLFTDGLNRDTFVNQLGSGTVLCRGRQMPTLEYMESSAGFVDLRFAIHCARQQFPRICVARDSNWMTQLPVENSLFEEVTQHWSSTLTREAQEIAGFRFLPGCHPQGDPGGPSSSTFGDD